MRTITLTSPTDFEGWRQAARWLRAEQTPPSEVRWRVGPGDGNPGPKVRPVYRPGQAVFDRALVAGQAENGTY